MIRKMLGLAWEAAKVEWGHWKNPGAEFEKTSGNKADASDLPRPTVSTTTPARGPEEAGTISKPSWRTSSAGHVAALNSTSCPDCGAEKKVGWYRCSSCVEANRMVQRV